MIADRASAGPIEAVLFDWGNTLMIDDEGQTGPMALWRSVAATPDAHDVLRRLHPRHRLVVATNAADSNADLVRIALRRAGLDQFIDEIVTTAEAGSEKPEPAFFLAALKAAFPASPASPCRAVMVGDSWLKDMRGAMATGLRTVWLNPSRAPRPAGDPAPDAEIQRLGELVAVLAAMKERDVATP